MSNQPVANQTAGAAIAVSASAVVHPASSDGMTTKVIRGSLWTLGGQSVTLLVMLVTSPYVIRRLGAEAFGVLTLINVLIGYLAFADMGMGLAATRFGADAHVRQSDDEEGAIIWTSLLIAFVPATLSAALLVVFAEPLVAYALRLPEHLHYVAIWALRLAALGFVARTLAGVLTAPQLVRLRMDLNTYVAAGAGVAQNSLVMLALWLHGGLIAAVAVIAAVAMIMMLTHFVISGRLLRQVLRPRIKKTLLKPLLGFGGGLVLSTLAGIVLISGEKLLLARFASVTALAHYGVAASLAAMLAVVPAAMQRSLLPAFSQLQVAADRKPLEQLYTRALRGNLLWLAPAALLLCTIAKPFFTLWAGPEYGLESTEPFYILVCGLIFNVMAYVPHTLLMALGRSDLIARIHIAETLPYILVAAGLTYWFGAIGAALAWSLRVMVDALLFFLIARRIAAFSASPFPFNYHIFVMGILILCLPILMILGAMASPAVLIILSGLSIITYTALVWMKVLTGEERLWMMRLLFWRKRRLVMNA
jgi:O-antigen/teichoic acid export membrane protein